MSTQHTNLAERLRAYWRQSWPVIRQVIGWLCILLGVIGLFLPLLQGVLFLVIGIALVGRRNWLLRWAAVQLKLFVRRWAAHPHPWLSRAGGLALRGQQQLSRQRRRLAWHWTERRQARLLQQRPSSGQTKRRLLLGALVVLCTLLIALYVF